MKIRSRNNSISAISSSHFISVLLHLKQTFVLIFLKKERKKKISRSVSRIYKHPFTRIITQIYINVISYVIFVNWIENIVHNILKEMGIIDWYLQRKIIKNFQHFSQQFSPNNFLPTFIIQIIKHSSSIHISSVNILCYYAFHLFRILKCVLLQKRNCLCFVIESFLSYISFHQRNEMERWRKGIRSNLFGHFSFPQNFSKRSTIIGKEISKNNFDSIQWEMYLDSNGMVRALYLKRFINYRS